MVLIEAVIKAYKLDDVREALNEIGIGGMTVTEVMQTTAKSRKGRSFGGESLSLTLVPHIKIEIAVSRELTERIVEAIVLHGSAGKSEEGKIVVKKLDAVIRIRTGEMDVEALF